MNASWFGAPAYLAPVARASATWSLSAAPEILPVSLPITVFGAPALRNQQQWVSAPGIDPTPFGSTWLLADPYLYRPPQVSIHASWVDAAPYGTPSGTINGAWYESALMVTPSGFEAFEAGEPVLLWSQFASPPGWLSESSGLNHYALFEWEYAPPERVLNASWVGRDEYTQPSSPPLNAAWSLPAEAKQISLAGWDSQAFGAPSLPVVRAAGFNAALVPPPHIYNLAAPLRPSGFNALAVGGHSIWNWLQYVRATGYAADRYGTSYVQGGVKVLAPGGFSALQAGRPVVINTTADQAIALSGRGIAPPLLGSPGVSPRTLRPSGFYATSIGYAWVQFPPRPSGWLSSAFGYPVIADKAKYVTAGGMAAPAPGFPLVRDRAQTLRHAASPITSLFGDVQIRLLNQYIRPSGAYSQEFGDWSEVRSMRRPVYPPGSAHTSFGGTEIANKTPALWPSGIASQAFGIADVGFYYRTIMPSGVVAPYPQVMPPLLAQTPGLRPSGIAAPALPGPTVWPAVRGVGANGWDSQRHGSAMVAFSWRRIVADGRGIAGSGYGIPVVQHALRTVTVGNGLSFMAFGGPWVSRGLRAVGPEGIEYPYMSNHMIGTTRYVNAIGWESTRWLTRIIPENQLLEQIGQRFDVLGLARIENSTRSLFLHGITTYPEPFMHWGVARVWNLRQVITMTEDMDSGLAPPSWPKWTLIENRNKIIGALGFSASRYGYAELANKARLIEVAGMPAPALPEYQRTGSVTHRVRPLPIAGIEPPYISGWSVVYNKAFPLRPSSFLAELFGRASLENTRRYRSVQGFDAYAFGHAFVSFAIRELTFEGRYTIQPPSIPLPDIYLYRRYIEAPSIDDGKVAQQSIVETRFNRIQPKWEHRELFGEPAPRNRTPEYSLRGWDSSLFGGSHVRLEWRALNANGYSMDLFGRAIIADRRRAVQVGGFNSMLVSDKLTMRRIGSEPVPTQFIDLRIMYTNDDGEVVESSQGYGIAPPARQVSVPNLLKGYIFHGKPAPGREMTLWGAPIVTANTIRIEPGYWERMFGEPLVSLRIRRLEPPTMGQLVADSVDSSSGRDMGSWGKPRLSPYTIYAVLEAPAQAIRNHDQNPAVLRAVNTGARIGNPRVSQWLGAINPLGIPVSAALGSQGWGAGRPTIYSKRQEVYPRGTLMQRIGWPVIPGTRYVVVDDEDEVISPPAPGRPSVSRPPEPPKLLASGIQAGYVGLARVEYFHRTIRASGFFSQAMGSSRGSLSASMPQSLHVGPPHLHPVVGFNAAGYGEPWVSHRVRELVASGWESFLCEYTLEQFDQRMRVRRTSVPILPRRITPVGVAIPEPSMSDVKLGARYIRPDGNSDQYRKGAF